MSPNLALSHYHMSCIIPQDPTTQEKGNLPQNHGYTPSPYPHPRQQWSVVTNDIHQAHVLWSGIMQLGSIIIMRPYASLSVHTPLPLLSALTRRSRISPYGSACLVYSGSG